MVVPAGLGDPVGVNDDLGLEGGAADETDLARPDEVGERRQRLVEVGVRVGPMHLVEVDVVRGEASQARFHGAGDVAG